MRISDWSSDVCSSDLSSMTTTTIRSARKILRPTAPVPYKAGRVLVLLAWEKAGDDLARKPRGTECFGVDAAPARLDLGEHILAALDDRLVKGARALHFLEAHRLDDMIVGETGTAIGYLVPPRNPHVPGDPPGRAGE